jgi:phage shock protein E
MEKTALYVDVRRPEEYALGHIPGAVNVNLEEDENEFIVEVSRLAADHDITLYCQSGFRASYAQSLLHAKHDLSVHHLNGGISLYQGPLETSEVPAE